MQRIYILLLFFALASCASNKNFQSRSEVIFLKESTSQLVYVTSVGYGKNREDAISNAQKNAVHVILFIGIPQSSAKNPLVVNENVSRSNNSSYFENLLNGSRYKIFIAESAESSNLINMKGSYKIYMNLTINRAALQNDLEQNSVIRKFGY